MIIHRKADELNFVNPNCIWCFNFNYFIIFKDIEDPLKTDAFLIERLNSLILNEDFKKIFKDARSGTDEYTMLHLAAKCCRGSLCQILIQEYKLGIFYILFLQNLFSFY